MFAPLLCFSILFFMIVRHFIIIPKVRIWIRYFYYYFIRTPFATARKKTTTTNKNRISSFLDLVGFF